jgi:DNA modification methylase
MKKNNQKSRIGGVDDLKADPRNANRGTARGREALSRSLREFGPGRAVLTDTQGVILAGNKTVEAARALNIPIKVVESDGTHLLAIKRLDLDVETDARARGLALADNRVAELDLQWDPAMLEQLRASGISMDRLWNDQEWAELTNSIASYNADDDRVLAPEPTTIAPGDFFALDRHRLLCGDATNANDVTRLLGDVTPRLMVTDPPYGDEYQPMWRHQVYPQQRTAIGVVANDTKAAWPEAFQLFKGDVVYAWHAGCATGVVAKALEETGFVPRAQIIWVKQHFALSRGDYHWQHEPCWYAVRKGATSHWQGDRTQSTVWNVPNLNAMGGTRTGDNAPTGHGTQKPVRLFEIPILNHTSAGDAIFDAFVGSGTAVVAAEKLDRTAYAMDVDPQYVQVVITQWETFTGKKARRIGRAPSRRNV